MGEIIMMGALHHRAPRGASWVGMFDVAVVGSGIAGAWAAVALARRGLRVLLVAPEGVLGGSTSLASGIVSMQLAEPHLSWAERSAREYLRAGVARRVRAVWVAPRDCVDRLLGALAPRRIPSGVLDGDSASRLAGVRVEPPEGYRAAFTEDLIVDLGRLSAFLSAALERLRVEVWGCRASRAGRDYVDCGGRLVEAGEVVVAAGAWTPGILGVPPEALGASIYRCEASSVSLGGLRTPVYVDLETGESAYAVPESESTAIAGDGPNDLLEDPRDAAPLPGTPYEVLETLSAAVPAALESYPRASWAAPCLVAGDGYPLLGRPGRSAPLLFTGLDGYGLMVAPALAGILASHIADGSPIPAELRAGRPLEPWRGEGHPPEPYRLC